MEMMESIYHEGHGVNMMGNITSLSSTVSNLSAIIDQTPIDWDAFDSVLKGTEDINAYDEQQEETILSEFIMYVDFYKHGTILVDIVRHFLSCGYDVSANAGLNGDLALQALCWSSYDRHILDAAKVLMNAGAPVKHKSIIDGSSGESEDLVEFINWKLSGAWMVDIDFAFANVLEAYYAMAEAYHADKYFHSIDTYFACIGKPLTSVSAVNAGGTSALQAEGTVSVYSEPIILWFEDSPLVISCYTSLVVNPVYCEDQRNALTDVTKFFSSLVGATLNDIQHIGATICYFSFSNGKRLLFSSRSIDERKQVGTFEIRSNDDHTEMECLDIRFLCGMNGVAFSSAVTDYQEDALAVFCENDAFLLYVRLGTANKYRFELCSCSKELLTEYTFQYPIKSPSKISCFYEQDNLSALRFDCTEGFLYLIATDSYEIEVQLSYSQYGPLEKSNL